MAFWRKQVIVRIEANLSWQLAQDRRTGFYIGVCDPLNLNAMGDTFEEFQESANEALALLFTDLYETGEFERFLRDRDWRTLDELPPPGTRAPKFDVPFEVKKVKSEVLTAARA